MSDTREQICHAASAALAAAADSLPSIHAALGFDGFVDQIIEVVDKRLDTDRYEAVKTIDAFGQKILRAVGQSSNYELLVKQTKLGGNGPIMANALASVGLSITYIGCIGYPEIHPVFGDLSKRATVISIAPPSYTDALEFDDGKLMFGKHQSLKDVNWTNIIERVGRERMGQLISGAKLVGMVNWTMLPFMSDIWKRMQAEFLKGGSRGQRVLFVDLADPEKRTQADIMEALKILSGLQEDVDVILGLNLKESTQVAELLDIEVPVKSTELEPGEGAIEQTATAIRKKLNLGCVVIHPRKGAAAATAKESAIFAGPFVQKPKISTGAGDHFNAGFCLGRVLNMSLAQSLATGVATSGFYVRTAQSPGAKDLAEFLGNLPAPQGNL